MHRMTSCISSFIGKRNYTKISLFNNKFKNTFAIYITQLLYSNLRGKFISRLNHSSIIIKI